MQDKIQIGGEHRPLGGWDTRHSGQSGACASRGRGRLGTWVVILRAALVLGVHTRPGPVQGRTTPKSYTSKDGILGFWANQN